MVANIAVALPPREGFSPEAFGAVALCVRDFALHSAYRSHIHVLGTVDAPAFAGVEYAALRLDRRWYERQMRAYARAVLRYASVRGCALIEVHNRPLLARYLLRLAKIPVLLHLHNDPQEMRAAKTGLERQWLAKHCAAVVCVSEYIRLRFCEQILDREKVHVVYNGLDMLEAPPERKQKQIVYVGRMTPNKGALVLAQALRLMLRDYPEWRAVFIGGRRHSESVELSGYERDVVAALRPLEEQVDFRGFCGHSEVMQATREAAIAVVPSLWAEPFGRTALEAMAQGCAVVTSGRGGLAEVVEGAGIIEERMSPEALARTLRRIIENGEERALLQHAAFRQAQRFEIGAMTQALDTVRGLVLER